MQNLTKEQTAAANFAANLEAQYEWIAEECEYVYHILRNVAFMMN